LEAQGADHIQDLGVVKLGFLIKAKAGRGEKFPTVLDHSVPLSGFDIYHFRAGETTDALPEPILEYRVGTEETSSTVIEISGTDLGRSNPEAAVRIPLSAIRGACEKSGLVFERVRGRYNAFFLD
jgi:hypothetical protein